MRISDWSSDVCSSDLEIVPWLRELSEACHAHGAAVMMQITHLGRRTAWNRGDWLPVLVPSTLREQIGRASCRERVCQNVQDVGVAVSIKKKKVHAINEDKSSHI